MLNFLIDHLLVFLVIINSIYINNVDILEPKAFLTASFYFYTTNVLLQMGNKIQVLLSSQLVSENLNYRKPETVTMSEMCHKSSRTL